MHALDIIDVWGMFLKKCKVLKSPADGSRDQRMRINTTAERVRVYAFLRLMCGCHRKNTIKIIRVLILKGVFCTEIMWVFVVLIVYLRFCT